MSHSNTLSFHNKKVKIGPFFKKRKLMSGRKCVILNEQYSFVFSTPMHWHTEDKITNNN